MIVLSTLLISMFTTIVLIPLFMGLAVKLKALDIPNERKVHQIPTPKSGGISMTLGALVPVFLWMPKNEFTQSVMIGAWIIILFGLIDDFRDIDYKIKFSGQLAATLIVVLYGGVKITSLGGILPSGYILHDVVAIPLTVLIVVGVTNAINLADGLDGLAGGISMLSFLCIGYLGYVHNDRSIVILSIAIVGAIIGFLRYNTFPASVFMGDAGSQLLGFLLITLSLNLTQNSEHLSPVLPLIIIGVPVLDTLVVMMERLAHGRSPFQPDKKHLHHKMLRLGFYHSESVLGIYCLHALLITTGFLMRANSDWLLLFIYVVYSGGAIYLLWLANRRGWKRLRDHGVIDKKVKGRLRIIKNQYIIIKASFNITLLGVPALFIATCFIPQQIPREMSILSIVFLLIAIYLRIYKKQWVINSIRFPLYLLIPFLIYSGEKNTSAWIHPTLLQMYAYAYVAIVVFIILTLRFTRRHGFKATPMDFLILFVALVIPNLPDAQIKAYQMGWIASKIIAFYFCFEVLNGELRTDQNKLIFPVIVGMVVIAARGVLGL